ncbi:MAG: transposase, partial [Candidatus Aenigmarchaeota archaeon]|nr:transposase [Candidatus Aenigmarchaeota archaeon]
MAEVIAGVSKENKWNIVVQSFRGCRHCGLIGKNSRKEKEYHCTGCGMVENADANAGFNIASLYRQGISQFNKERGLL